MKDKKLSMLTQGHGYRVESFAFTVVGCIIYTHFELVFICVLW